MQAILQATLQPPTSRRSALRILVAATLSALVAGGCASRPAAQPGAAAPGAAQPGAVERARPRLVLDTDANNELDDQHAIAYALAHADVWSLRGITTNRTHDGGEVARHTEEAARVVRLMGAAGRLPIATGANGAFAEIRPHLGDRAYDGRAAVELIVREARAARPGDPLVVAAIGKLTNVALALAVDPSIAARMRVLWLGSHFPAPGEYNFDNDPEAVAFVLDSTVPLDLAVVREGEPTGTAAVQISVDEIRRRMPGRGPRVSPPVPGRDGGAFSTFGDYSVNLFERIGDEVRALYDLAAIAALKEPRWARWTTMPAPAVRGGAWAPRPGHARVIRLVTDFDREAIVADLFERIARPVLPSPSP